MAKGKWKIGVVKQYVAFRVLDVSKPEHDENIECGEFSENYEELKKLVDELNAKETTS